MSINPENNYRDQYSEPESIVLNLENLTIQYNNLLIQYQQAVANYTTFLQEESTTPCGRYTSDSTNIDQACYNDIWQKAGCTQPPKTMSSQTASTTLDGWILDSFNMATNTDDNSRMTCYGHVDSKYMIIAVGTDGNLWCRPDGLTGNGQKVNDDSNGNIRSICTGSDGKMIIGINSANQVITKPTWDSPSWTAPISCSIGPPSYTQVTFLSMAQAQDGTLVGVGTDHTLWTAPELYNYFWTNVATNTNGNESENAVCIGPNGRVVVANGIDLWYKDSYQNLQNQVWQYGGPGCCLDITVAPDGTLMDAGACNDYQIWTIDSYMNLDGGWKGPYPGTCCIISLTTVINTNYAASGYSTATQPNYNIDSQQLTAIQGQAFWGTGPIGSQNPYTDITSVNDCQALCSSTANCTGATFNPTANTQPMCWLRTGEGEPMPGLPNDYAIVPKAVELLNIVDQINTQLIAVNDVILKNATNGEPIYDGEAYLRKNKTKELIVNYEILQKERKKIRDELKHYERLNAEEVDGNININQNYYSFLLLMLLTVIVIYMLFKFSIFYPAQSNIFSSPQQGGGFLFDTDTTAYIYYLLFTMIVLLLLVIYYQKIVQTTTTTLNYTATTSATIFNMLSGGLTSGPVYNFN